MSGGLARNGAMIQPVLPLRARQLLLVDPHSATAKKMRTVIAMDMNPSERVMGIRKKTREKDCQRTMMAEIGMMEMRRM